MNPIQVNCPECQKLFRVQVEDLGAGLVRFQCTRCQCTFGFDWPQPPGIEHIKALPVDQSEPSFIKAENQPSAEASVPTLNQPMRICPRCQAKSPENLKECVKCGVIFEKVTRIKSGVPEVRPSGPDIVTRWEQVKSDYSNLASHEEFLKLCLSRNNLHYAGSQYRAVLAANPNEEIARKMQTRILELATAAYLANTPVNARTITGPDGQTIIFGEKATPRKRLSLSNIFMIIGGGMVIGGLIIPQVRGLIAVGISILVFVFSMRYFNRQSN